MSTLNWCIVAGCALTIVLSVLAHLILRRVRYWHELVTGNGKICYHNQKLLNKIELTSFGVREHTLWMHDIHRDTLLVISQLDPKDPEQLMALQRVQSCLQQALNVIDENFYHTFKKTPEQYRQDKVHLNYRSGVTGRNVEWRDNFGVN